MDNKTRNEREAQPVPTARSGAKGWFFLALLLAAAVVAALLWTRSREQRQLAATTREMAVPTVTVTHPQLGPTETEVVLPGNLTAYSEASIYARTNGYLKAWHTDLGAKVTEGELLAEIEAPDIDAQLLQVSANLAQARANLENARLNFERQKNLLQKKAASQQDFDQVRTSLEAMQAAVQAGEANVQNLTVQKNFQKIVAPFSGVVTRRNTDVGALISAGAGEELFHLARTDILRAFIYVPQAYSSSVRVGAPAHLQLLEFPGEKFEGKVAHVSGAIDPKTRTLLTEVQISNADGRLFPGAYAQVHLVLPLPQASPIVPVNTLLFRDQGMQVGVVDNHDVVHLKHVTIGHDFGTTVEITEGLKADDRIVLNPADSIADGSTVRVEEPKK